MASWSTKNSRKSQEHILVNKISYQDQASSGALQYRARFSFKIILKKFNMFLYTHTFSKLKYTLKKYVVLVLELGVIIISFLSIKTYIT